MSTMTFLGPDAAPEDVTPELAGSKAAEIWRMSKLGLTVPPAFVLPTTWCKAVNANDAHAIETLGRSLNEGMTRLEKATGKTFGDGRLPLLVSVRSGAARSMPGMMSTVLDVGLNAETVRGLIGMTGNPRMAWDSYRRFIQIYSEVVANMSPIPFEQALVETIAKEGVANESELDSEALEGLTQIFREISGRAVPDDPKAQLHQAALAVYRSWDQPRAIAYRRLNNLEYLTGTAVTVQAMVFGNAGRLSGSGVAFSRDPATGANELYIDFLFDAQGEDLVGGRRNPSHAERLKARLPQVAAELADGAARLERDARDMQDIEFTVENGKLFFLQTRAAKRTPYAGLRVLVDLVREGLLDQATAWKRAQEIDVARAARTRFADRADSIASAVVASPGVASGRAAFDNAEAIALAARGDSTILVRPDAATDDVPGFAAASGILTAHGGRTSHAAVVARQMGKVCLVGCKDLVVDDTRHTATLAGRPIAQGDWLSLDGGTGEVTLGRREIISERPEAELAEIARWREVAPSKSAVPH